MKIRILLLYKNKVKEQQKYMVRFQYFINNYKIMVLSNMNSFVFKIYWIIKKNGVKFTVLITEP